MKYFVFSLSCFFLSQFFLEEARAEDCPKALEMLRGITKSAQGERVALSSDKNSIKKELKEVEKLCPTLVDVPYEYGRLYLAEGDFESALVQFKKADALKPRLEYLLGVAKSLTHLKKYVEAESAFKDAIAKYSGDWKAIEGLGVLYLILGRFQESEELFNQALQDESNAASLYYNLGVALERQGRVDESGVSYRTSLLKDSRHKEARMALAKRSLDSGRISEAASYIEEGILYFPKDYQMQLLHAELYEAKGDPESALEVLERIQEPAHATALAARKAVLMIKSGSDKDEGVKALEKLYKEGDKAGSIDVIRAYVWYQIKNKNFTEAETIIRSSLVTYPDDSVLLNNLGVLLEESGKPEEAKDFFRKAALHSPYSETIQGNQSRLQ